MKSISSLTLLTLFFFSCLTAHGASQPAQIISLSQKLFSEVSVSSEFNRLTSKALQEGSVQVIVALAENLPLENNLQSRSSFETQSKLIEKQQNALLSEVAISRIKSIKRFSNLPFLAASVNTYELQRLRASKLVAQVFEDHINFPAFHELSIAKIGADAGWGLGYTGAGQTIAILDNGIDKYHPLLLNKVIGEACFSTRDSAKKITPQCRKGRTVAHGPGSATVKCKYLDFACTHGTFLAGLAAGNSLAAGFAGSGVAPQATILAVKINSLISNNKLCAPAVRCHVFFDSDLLRGLDFVYRMRRYLTISSVNISLAGNANRKQCSIHPIKRIVAKLRGANIATIAASGNDGYGFRLSFPACIPGIISVGSTNAYDAVSSFSNSAGYLSLLAPGENIGLPMPGVVPEGYEVVGSGTSMSAAFVSGTWAVLKQHKPTATVNEILSVLMGTGMPVYNPRNGTVKSRIQVNQAHAALIP